MVKLKTRLKLLDFKLSLDGLDNIILTVDNNIVMVFLKTGEILPVLDKINITGTNLFKEAWQLNLE